MLSEDKTFTKENLDSYLKALGKEFRKQNGTAIPAEIILIGGAAILVNYGFRDMTTDIDAVIRASSAMQDAINTVGSRFELPAGWLNSDFMKTAWNSAALSEISENYHTLSNVLKVRTVSGEYLIAMKLRSGRKYKNDLSDVVGILTEQYDRGKELGFDDIDKAVQKLYGGWESFPEETIRFLTDLLADHKYLRLFEDIRIEEIRAKEMLIDFENGYPHTLKESNLDSILEALRKKADK